MRPPKKPRIDESQNRAYPNLQEEMERACRQRNFGDSTRCFHAMKSANFSPNCVLLYIKACLRCGQVKIAQVWKEKLLAKWNPLSEDCKSQLQQVLCRGYGDNMDMAKLYEEVRAGIHSENDEAVCQDILRGMAKAGWVVEGINLVKQLGRPKSISMITVQLINELIHGLTDATSSSSRKAFARIQKKWLELAAPAKTIPEMIAEVKIHIMLYDQSGERDKEKEATITKLIEAISERLRSEHSKDSEKLPSDDQLASSIFKFWEHKMEQLKRNFEEVKKFLKKSKGYAPVLYLHTSVDHAIEHMPHCVWSNRYHPLVFDTLYNREDLKPGHRPGELPERVNDYCASFLKTTDWSEASKICQEIESNVRSKLQAAKKETAVLCELGAGDGDWAIKQQEDLVVINELRWTRCAHIRGLIHRRNGVIDNYVVLGGDGTKVVEEFLKGVCRKIQINFPEPPAVKEDPSNWLCSRLFNVIHDALRADSGEFSLISDQRSLMEYVDAFIAKKQIQAKKWTCLSEKGPWHFQQITDENALEDLALSFFGQLWAKGNKSYFVMHLARLQEQKP